MVHTLWNFDRCLGRVTLGDVRLVDDIVMGHIQTGESAERELIDVALAEPSLFCLMHRHRHLDNGDPITHPALAGTAYFDDLERLVSARLASTCLSLRNDQGQLVRTRRLLVRRMDAEDLESPELRRTYDDAVALWDLMHPPKPWWQDVEWPEGMSEERKAEFIASVELDAEAWEKSCYDCDSDSGWRGDMHAEPNSLADIVREIRARDQLEDRRFLLLAELENAANVPRPPALCDESDTSDERD